MDRQILTVRQAAKLLQIDPNTIYRWARSGKFPASKIGKEWRVLHHDVLKFIESHKKRGQFLTDVQEAELLTALVGRREIPLKLQYLSEGADRYTSFQHPKEYGGESEFEIISDNQARILNLINNKSFNLVDLGCGDGKKAAFFISQLGKAVRGYFALDLSRRMIEICSENMDLTYPDLEKESFQDDFEQGNVSKATYYLHRRYGRSNLIIFLGNTIGNISDAHRVLVNIAESMTENDLLVVGMAFYNPQNIPLASYNKPEAIEIFWTVPEKLGIRKSDAKIYATYNKSRRQIECQLEFLKDWSQTFSGNLLHFPKGQRIRLAISRRFTRDDIFELFANSGFKTETLLIDKEKNNALVLCRLHNWEKSS